MVVSTGPETDLNASLNHFWAQRGKPRLYFWAGLIYRPCPCALPHPPPLPSPLVTARPIFLKENSFLNHFATGFGTSHLRLLGALLLCEGRGQCRYVGKAKSRQSRSTSTGCTAVVCFVTPAQKGLVSELKDTINGVSISSVSTVGEFGQQLSSSPSPKQQHSQSSFQEQKEATERAQGRVWSVICLNILKVSINDCSLPAAAIEWRK